MFPATRPASYPPRRLPASRRRSRARPDGEGITSRSDAEPARPGQPCPLGVGTRPSPALTRACPPARADPAPGPAGPAAGAPSAARTLAGMPGTEPGACLN
jgi:hypothetical protein